MTLSIIPADVNSPEAALLINELNIELNALYDTEGGTGDFAPTDMELPRSLFVIAWLDGEAVGCGAFRPMYTMYNASDAEVKRMYVRPAFRGRGISRSILSALEQQAQAFGYHYLQLETGRLQPEAIGLYESVGFYRIPNFGKYVGDEMSVCYQKKISGARAEPISIQTRADFIRFVDALLTDYQTYGVTWENPTLERYLEVIARWTEDMGNSLERHGTPMPDPPTWQLFAEILSAARDYE